MHTVVCVTFDELLLRRFGSVEAVQDGNAHCADDHLHDVFLLKRFPYFRRCLAWYALFEFVSTRRDCASVVEPHSVYAC